MNSNLRGVPVWDAPVRMFHWLLVASFAGAWLTAESERWQWVHATLGYTMAALVGFRIVWGLVGTRHARFAAFVRGPAAAGRYLGALLKGRPEQHAGHNPAGALAILALMVLIGVTAASGVATYNDLGGEWLEELHEGAANTLLALVIVHVIGVVVGSLAHGENLARAMITGRKRAPRSEGIDSPMRAIAALMLVMALGFWALQWYSAPAAAGDAQHAAGRQAHIGDADRDDDD
jgi:cytochrome b